MSQITIGLLTSPLPFLLVGACGGAIIATIAGAFAAGFVSRRRDKADNAAHAAAARLAIGMRRVIDGIDQGESPEAIRATASHYLTPADVREIRSRLRKSAEAA